MNRRSFIAAIAAVPLAIAGGIKKILPRCKTIKDPRLFIDGVDLSDYVKSVSINYPPDAEDVGMVFPGLRDWSMELSFRPDSEVPTPSQDRADILGGGIEWTDG